MPSGVVRLKMAKTYHTMPIAPYGMDDQGDLSGLSPTPDGVNNDIVLRGYKDAPAAPKKFRPFGSSRPSAKTMAKKTDQVYGVKNQAPPEASEVPLTDGKSSREGKVRGRQADKSSKSK